MHTVPVPRLDGPYRTIGAVTGGGLALAVFGVLYALSSIPAVGSITLLSLVLDPSRGAEFGGSLLWAVAPVSAAIAGWLLAPRALAGDRWSGAAMGFVTYFTAIVVGPLVVLSPRRLRSAVRTGSTCSAASRGS